MIKLQHLDDLAILHKVDLAKDLPEFFERHPYLRFKLIFLDCGIANVLEECLKNVWPRLVRGGVLILDHYNSEQSPSESEIVDRYIGANQIQQMSFNRQPSGYVIKMNN